MEIHLDIESCPSQIAGVRDLIAAGITCPGNISKAETIAAWEHDKKPGLIEDAWLKTSFDGALGHVAVIGLAFNDETPVTVWSPDWLDREADMLQEAFDLIHDRCSANLGDRPIFVGHNIIGFDFRFLFQRAVMLGVKPTPFIPFGAKPWDDQKVFDTMVQWAGARDSVSLDKLSSVLGLGGKGDMDGSRVWAAVREGRIADVADYCADDIIKTRGVYKRMTFAPPVEIPSAFEFDGLPF
jgi:hypothetical protein